jgi:predicted membrane protein
MKMAPAVFWGILLVIIGLSIIFRILFDINLFRVLLGVILILIGIKILVGNKGIFNFGPVKGDVIFSSRTISEPPGNKAEYNVVFARSVFDYRKVYFKKDKPVKIKINTIFGATEIKVNEDSPVKIKVNAVFAGAKLPDGNTVVFGSGGWQGNTFDPDGNYMIIEADVVFGSLEVKSNY